MKISQSTFQFLFYSLYLCITTGCHAAADSHVITPGTSIITHSRELKQRRCAYILACDAGRHEIRAGIFTVNRGKPQLITEFHTPAGDLNALSADRSERFALHIKNILDHIKNDNALSVTQACIAAAGPTAANRDFIDDLHAPFAVSASEIKKHTCLKNILVINDFETLALGVEAVDPSEITTLLPGIPRTQGTKLIIGAGAGLGSSLLLWNEKLQSYMPSPLNYSFTEFNPQNELELKYNEYLKRTSNNAWGKVLGAGAGIADIYNFLYEPETPLYRPADYQEIFAKRETDPACKAAVDMFMRLYIRLLRNAVYAQAPYAGLYITNDVAQKNSALFTDPSFKADFLNTGDLSNAGNAYLHNYLQQIPVYLVTSPNLKLFGAALYGISFFKECK